MKKSVLNSIKIKENFKKFDRIDFGCDWLTLSYSKGISFLNELLFGVDNDNSNFGVIDISGHDVTYSRVVTPIGLGLKFFIDYNGIPTPILEYVYFNKANREFLGKSAKICIYGAYYRLEVIGEFEYLELINFVKSLSDEDPVITRYDYRIDYFSQYNQVKVPLIPEIMGYIHNQSTIVTWKTGGKITDWRVGNPDTGRYAVRYYDKKIDTDKKNKWFLYTDFLDYSSVHRLEIQFGRAFCRGYTLSQLGELERKILEVLGIDGKIYDSNLFYQYNSNSEITLENAGKFLKRFNNLSDKLFKAGYSPFSVVESFLCAKYGKDVVKGLIDDFITKSLVYDLKSNKS